MYFLTVNRLLQLVLENHMILFPLMEKNPSKSSTAECGVSYVSFSIYT